MVDRRLPPPLPKGFANAPQSAFRPRRIAPLLALARFRYLILLWYWDDSTALRLLHCQLNPLPTKKRPARRVPFCAVSKAAIRSSKASCSAVARGVLTAQAAMRILPWCLRGGPGDRTAAALDMAGIAFEVMLDTGVLVEALPLWDDELKRPETFSNPALIHAIQREGLEAIATTMTPVLYMEKATRALASARLLLGPRIAKAHAIALTMPCSMRRTRPCWPRTRLFPRAASKHMRA